MVLLRLLKESGKASHRKLRLFAAACCRLFWDTCNIDVTRTAIETIERYADNQATDSELSRARSAAHSAAWRACWYSQNRPSSTENALERQYYSERLRRPTDEVLRRFYFVAFMANITPRLVADEMPMLRSDRLLVRSGLPLLRDIFRNPFHTVSPIQSDLYVWNGGTIHAVATAIYNDRASDRLPLLADALEDAGCTDAEILGHLRSPGPHVRGCWPVDWILRKE
jgi:hypothetical protein